jgi:ribulose bisphosphate carboxylase small subunit
MNIINYKLDTTNELLTFRIGLITLAHTIQVLDLSLSQGFNTLVVFTQASKPSADGLWGWYLLIGDKTQSPVFGNMNNIDALSKDTNIKKLRIDAAGYQASIIDYCFENDIEFSIRAKMCQSLKTGLAVKYSGVNGRKRREG